jgi:Ni/Co efflux regulator RcnB
MRKLLISLALASAAAATPALAEPDQSSWHSRRGDAQEARGHRNQSDDGQDQSDNRPRTRSSGGGQQNVSPQVDNGSSDNAPNIHRTERHQMSGGGSAGEHEQGGGSVVEQQQGGGSGTQGWRHRIVESGTSDEGTHDNGDRRAFWQQRMRTVPSGGAEDSGRIRRTGDLVQPERPLPRVFRPRTPVVSSIPREGTQPPLRTERRRTSHVEWNSNWRHDHRYDWWNWRSRHHSIFHLGFYYDPFGWSYRRYSIGWRFWPSYYSSRFWISDPWYYRLPYAPPGYRWIRYYDDAVLVDTFTGEVVDVIYDFFW